MSATARRSAADHARRGNSDRSGAVAVRSSRGGNPNPKGGLTPLRVVGAARTTGAAPRRISIQPSAAICAYASLTTPRETCSASASTREAGSRVPGGAPPSVIAAQIASSSCARSGVGALRSSAAKSSKVARLIGIEVALSEGPPRRYRPRS